MTPGRERQARLRQRHQGEGARQVTAWLDEESQARLAALRRRGESTSAVMRRALEALAEQHNHGIEAQIQAIVARRQALHEVVHALYYGYEPRLTARQIARLINTVVEPLAPGERWDEDTVASYLMGGSVSDWSVFGLKKVP